MCEVLLLFSVIKRSEDNGIFPVEAGFIYIIIKLLWCRYRIYVIWYCMDVCIHLNISCTLFILCVIFVRKRDFNLNESFSWINRGYILRDNNFYEVVIFNGLKWSLNVGLTKQSFIIMLSMMWGPFAALCPQIPCDLWTVSGNHYKNQSPSHKCPFAGWGENTIQSVYIEVHFNLIIFWHV